MTDPRQLADDLALRALNDAFIRHIDRDEVDALVALFTADALYVSGGRRVEGADELRAYFQARTAQGPRTSRHFYAGLHVTYPEPDLAHASSNWMSFAQNGTPPLSPPLPFLVADFEDVYVRSPDGWRIRQRRIVPVFRHAPAAG